MTLRPRTIGRLMLPVSMAGLLFLVARSDGDAQTPPTQAIPNVCPGQPMPVQATGVYTPRPVTDITINGQPAPGAIWSPGMRSYWHCHAGGQVMMLDEGVGRVQQRGQKMRVLHKGDTEYAAPGVEHWHGAAPDASAHFFQTSIGNTTTLWMEEVGTADYMGNDIGITSRNEFLRTGERKKADVPVPAGTPAAAPTATSTAGSPRR
ncbi:MAG: cupin domain-containing protein [Acidobacteria bacterium]|nr:cupin domain-containing protein [Acidobacteriota bacterium]